MNHNRHVLLGRVMINIYLVYLYPQWKCFFYNQLCILTFIQYWRENLLRCSTKSKISGRFVHRSSDALVLLPREHLWFMLSTTFRSSIDISKNIYRKTQYLENKGSRKWILSRFFTAKYAVKGLEHLETFLYEW
jgi:hypothetical protein